LAVLRLELGADEAEAVAELQGEIEAGVEADAGIDPRDAAVVVGDEHAAGARPDVGAGLEGLGRRLGGQEQEAESCEREGEA
jgi:hypothetical protein